MPGRRFARSVLAAVAALVVTHTSQATAIDMTGIYRTQIGITLLPDPVICSLDFTQTGAALTGSGSCGPLAGLTLTGTINAFGIFSVTGAVPFICPTLQINGLALGNGASFSGFYTCPGAPVPLAGTISGTRCGNGLLDVGETCDDSNITGGDCCSATCQLEPSGAACASDANPCTTDRCDGAGTCTHPNNALACDDGLNCTSGDTCGGGSCHGAFIPSGGACDDGNPCTPDDACDGAGTCVAAGALDCGPCMACTPGTGCSAAGLVPTTCNRPSVPTAQLVLKNAAGTARDRADWKFVKGTTTLPSAFGDPRTTTPYTLCVYDQTTGGGYDRALLGLQVPAGAGWTQTSSGFKFRDRSGPVRGIVLKVGAAGFTKIVVKAQGGTLPTLPLDLSSPVLVQLQAGNGNCWESAHATAAVNSAARFKSKTGSPGDAFID